MFEIPRDKKCLAIARELIGKVLVRKIGRKIIREVITETEAYVGPHDLACHASKGRTQRTEVMFKDAGTIYVYFTYGIHWMLNIVTETEGYPAAVLIRGTKNFNGPARLTKGLQIDKSLNGKKLGKKTGLWIENNLKIENSKLKISQTPRIGIAYSGPIWTQKPYRFVLKEEWLPTL